MRTPASVYRPSTAACPRHCPQPQYPFADLVHVDTAGSIRWGVYKYFVSHSLAGERLGI